MKAILKHLDYVNYALIDDSGHDITPGITYNSYCFAATGWDDATKIRFDRAQELGLKKLTSDFDSDYAVEDVQKFLDWAKIPEPKTIKIIGVGE